MVTKIFRLLPQKFGVSNTAAGDHHAIGFAAQSTLELQMSVFFCFCALTCRWTSAWLRAWPRWRLKFVVSASFQCVGQSQISSRRLRWSSHVSLRSTTVRHSSSLISLSLSSFSLSLWLPAWELLGVGGGGSSTLPVHVFNPLVWFIRL